MNRISVKPSTIARNLGLFVVLLVLASIAGQFSKYLFGYGHLKGLVPLFYLDREANVPTYFSVLLMLFASLLLALISILNRSLKLTFVSSWAILSVGFLYMGFDEAFQVHERLIEPMRTLLGDGGLGIFYFAWTIAGTAIVFLLGLFFFSFLQHLPAAVKPLFLVAASVYIGGVIGLEFVGGYYAEIHGTQNLTYSMIATVEESMEMFGLALFNWALLKYFVISYKEVTFRFDN